MMSFLNRISDLPLAFGGAAISGEGGGYGFGNISESDSLELLNKAYQGGFRIFDTAPIYGFGLSEQRMGMAFKQYREKVFIVSKSGVTWGNNKRVDMTNDPVITRKMLEQSLRDLQSEYIDLYMIHWPDSKIDIRRPLEILAKAKDEGKIKHIGLCNTTIDELEKGSEIEHIEVVQSEFNFFQNKASLELFPYLKKHNISFMSWGTLDKGILTGQVNEKRKFDESDCRSWAPWWKKADHKPKFEIMKKIKPTMDKNQISGLELALGYNLNFTEMSIAICGAKNSDQLSSLLKAINHLPDKKLILELVELADFENK